MVPRPALPLALALLALTVHAAAPAPPAQAGTAAALAIHDWPLPFSEDRARLTLAYWRQHYGGEPTSLDIVPRVIVLHWTGSGSLLGAWNTFAPARAAAARPELAAAGEVNVSAHFLVDRDGTIYRLMPETWMARHCIGLNAVSIGIENVGDGATHPLTEEQVEANAALVRDLAARHPITHLIGHLEYRAFEGHPYFQELDPAYRTGKADPGAAFMAAVRARVAGLGLQGPPGPPGPP